MIKLLFLFTVIIGFYLLVLGCSPPTEPHGTGWNIEKVDGGVYIYCGRWCCVALDSLNNPHILYEYSSQQYNPAIKYTFYDGFFWHFDIVAEADSSIDPLISEYLDYPSLAIDNSNSPHIVYHKQNYFPYGYGTNLYYARYDSNAWLITHVDSGGSYCSLALDNEDKPHISYDGYDISGLMHAYFNGTTWEITEVDPNSYPAYISIAVDRLNRVHLSYYDLGDEDLKYACGIGGNWQHFLLDSIGDVGKWSSIAVDSSGNPHICYYDETNHKLKYAVFNGVTWEISTISNENFTGEYCDIAIDSSDNPHISCGRYEGISYDLRYFYYDGATWHEEIADNSGGAGCYTSIAIDSLGYPHISYQNSHEDSLKYAVRSVTD